MFKSIQENEFLIILILGIGSMLFIVILVIVFFLISKNRILKEKQLNERMQLEHKEHLLRSNIEAQESERSRLAGELHDDIGSKLCVIKLLIIQLAKNENIEKAEKKYFDQSLDLMDHLVETTRRISHELYPPMLEELGLTATIQQFLANLKGVSEIDISFHSEVNIKLGVFTELQIFRIVQESIKNAINHGLAKSIKVKIRNEDNHTIFIVSDNGQGFDTSQINMNTGMGLKNIYKRSEMINAKLNISSTMNIGTKIQLELPLQLI